MRWVVDQLVESEAFNLSESVSVRQANVEGKETGLGWSWHGQRVENRSDTVLAERSPHYAVGGRRTWRVGG